MVLIDFFVFVAFLDLEWIIPLFFLTGWPGTPPWMIETLGPAPAFLPAFSFFLNLFSGPSYRCLIP